MSEFELILFYANPADAAEAGAAGIEGLVVDWERRGKARRQRDAATEINHHTAEDLRRARGVSAARLICRVDPPGPALEAQIESAIDCAADEVLLPMVRTVEEVEHALELARGRIGVGVLVETEAAVAAAAELSTLPLSRAYIGLNDLSIELGCASIFDPVADGTVERVRAEFDLPFGFGGLTLPDRGAPVPCRLLIAEMARLRCSFSFLRRHYRCDLAAAGGHAQAAQAIRRGLAAARLRPGPVVEADRRDLHASIVRSRQRSAVRG